MKSIRSLRSDAASIWAAGLRAVDPERAVLRHVRRRGGVIAAGAFRIDLGKTGRAWVIGAGKAAAPMARALERVLGPRAAGGLLVTKHGHGFPLRRCEILEAGHPLPDEDGLAAGRRIAEFVDERIGPGDLVFCLFSGGGSALLVAPAPGITLEDKLATTRLLLNAGATIHELNAIRKHLSSLKGGGLARLLARHRVVSLLLSDVVGDSLDTIASGPLAPDSATFGDCLEILERFGLAGSVPPAVLRRFQAGARGEISETPKPGDPIFRRKENLIVGSSHQACAAAAARARRLGYHTVVLSSTLEGDTAEAAGFHMAVAREIALHGRPARRPACLLSGGETTVKVTGQGKGGRNQEFVLRCVAPLGRLPAPCVAASIGTDGTDGPTDAAGALADNRTLTRSLRFGPGFLAGALRDNDSYRFFERLGDLIVTGPTRTNVMDLRILLVG